MSDIALYLGICMAGYIAAIPLRKSKDKLNWIGMAQTITVLILVFIIGSITLVPACREVYIDGARVALTQKEFEVLCCLARFSGQTVTRGQLLQSVWGYDNDDDPSRTVDSHIKTLRLKIGDPANTPRFIQTVRGTGYRLIAGETV